MTQQETLSVGLITSGGSETEQYVTLLEQHGVTIKQRVTSQEITTDHIGDDQLHIWLLDIDDEDWTDSLDDLLDQSHVPVFFHERGSLNKQSHPDYWVEKQIDRLYEMAGIERIQQLSDEEHAIDSASSSASDQHPTPEISSQETQESVEKLEQATNELTDTLVSLAGEQNDDVSSLVEPISDIAAELKHQDSESNNENFRQSTDETNSLDSDFGFDDAELSNYAAAESSEPTASIDDEDAELESDLSDFEAKMDAFLDEQEEHLTSEPVDEHLLGEQEQLTELHDNGEFTNSSHSEQQEIKEELEEIEHEELTFGLEQDDLQPASFEDEIDYDDPEFSVSDDEFDFSIEDSSESLKDERQDQDEPERELVDLEASEALFFDNQVSDDSIENDLSFDLQDSDSNTDGSDLDGSDLDSSDMEVSASHASTDDDFSFELDDSFNDAETSHDSTHQDRNSMLAEQEENLEFDFSLDGSTESDSSVNDSLNEYANIDESQQPNDSGFESSLESFDEGNDQDGQSIDSNLVLDSELGVDQEEPLEIDTDVDIDERKEPSFDDDSTHEKVSSETNSFESELSLEQVESDKELDEPDSLEWDLDPISHEEVSDPVDESTAESLELEDSMIFDVDREQTAEEDLPFEGELSAEKSSFHDQSLDQFADNSTLNENDELSAPKQGFHAAETTELPEDDLAELSLDFVETETHLSSGESQPDNVLAPVDSNQDDFNDGSEDDIGPASTFEYETNASELSEEDLLSDDAHDEGSLEANSSEEYALDDIPLLDETAGAMQFEELSDVDEAEGSRQALWVLGASLGGPAAVKRFLQALKSNLKTAFVLAQHIDENFLPVLCNILDTQTAFSAKIVEHKMPIEDGNIYIAPIGNKIVFNEDDTVEPIEEAWTRPYAPCIDDVIAAAGETYRKRCGVIIFSGMGNDGVIGLEQVKHYGVTAWTQSSESCANSSMPDSVKDAGLSAYTGDPEELAAELCSHLEAQTEAIS